MTDGLGNDELTAAVVKEAVAHLDAEERALLRLALTRPSGEIDKDTERMLSLLVKHDTQQSASFDLAERWALAAALRRFRGMSWTRSHELAQRPEAHLEPPVGPADPIPDAPARS